MKKYILLILGLFFIKQHDINFITKEINICSIVSAFASNLYINNSFVSSKNIEVIDYSIIDNNNLCVIPINSDVILPINGIITKICNNCITIESNTGVYTIYDVKSSYKLYQYYNAFSILGESSKYVINSNNIANIVSAYILNYEVI